jgi:putative peptidoglycan lipid II flippase
MKEFAETVNASIYKIVATALLATGFMMAAALPLIDIVYRRGHLTFTDSQEIAVYFFWFSVSLIFWSAQGLYARAFYAAGNTLTPMVASTVVTLLSIPMYAILFHSYSVVGLVMASNLGIAANCLVMAILLHQRKLVLISDLPWSELLKAAVTATVAGFLSYEVARAVLVNNSRIADFKALGLITITWAAAVAAGLWITKSHLPGELRRRKTPVGAQ